MPKIRKKRPESIAGAIFSSDRTQILLTQRRDVPVWVLPGGGIEPEESAERAIVREILEETGFHVKVCRKVGLYIPTNRLARVTVLYECKVLKGTAQIGEETRNIQFFPLKELPSRIPPPYDRWIREAHQIAPPLVRFLKEITYLQLFKSFLLHPWLVVRFLLSRVGCPLNTKA